METKVIRVDPRKPEPPLIEEAARVIKAGGLVAFPTETVYGLGADGLNPNAVKRIFEVKGRPLDNPLIFHVSSPGEALALAEEVPEEAQWLMDRFWPGPLTLVLRKKSHVPDVATAGLATVAVRMPDCPIALALIEASHTPIVAPSANLSGKPSPTKPQHVIADLQGKVEVIIDGGDTPIGVESTVVDLTRRPFTILRPGGLSREALEEVVGPVGVHQGAVHPDGLAPPSPGMKYRHYAPQAQVVLVEGERGERLRKMAELVGQLKEEGLKVGALTVGVSIPGSDVERRVQGLEDYAHNLFAFLREMDELDVDVIVAEGVEERRLGLALMNRLRKAATRVVRV